MNEELIEACEDLISYFDLDSEEWPVDSVYTNGEFTTGIISDELQMILSRIKNIVREEE